jgi:hypothetical protein
MTVHAKSDVTPVAGVCVTASCDGKATSGGWVTKAIWSVGSAFRAIAQVTQQAFHSQGGDATDKPKKRK